ncbi:protein saal1 [Zeugodacus cucurbitae]|uniref:protein saal1 n=1 Tax=Zeugodacus cucurbitae TaxID=28588 RepID=UPI0023D96D33|nr:protein saal1 [Zeugodacus cucurbitae]
MEKDNITQSSTKTTENIKDQDGLVNQLVNDDNSIKGETSNLSVHPDGSDQVEEDLALMRGDAIGTTLYSERFVLSTLLKLTKLEKELAEIESFENDLCSVWDMTIEEDVVHLLLEHNVLDLFAHCINATTDKRLVEILVGILGNMCNFKESRGALVIDNSLVQILLDLTNCSDSPTLLQLTRLFSVVLIHADRQTALQWYQHISLCPDFIKNITFILGNSINEQLLRQTIETLNAILAKFALIEPNQEVTKNNEDDDSNNVTLLPTFEQLFVNESLIKATTEAFLALLPRRDNPELQENHDEDNDDVESTIMLTQSTHNLMQIFLNIHCILTQYDNLSQNSYFPHIDSLMDCLGCILEPLCNPRYIEHLTNQEQDLLDSINDIFESLGDPFDERCLIYTISIWNLLRLENERLARKTPPENGFEDNAFKEDEFNFETGYLTILDMIVRVINAATDLQLENALKENLDDNMRNLQSTLSIGDNEQPSKQCYLKIQKILENLQK